MVHKCTLRRKDRYKASLTARIIPQTLYRQNPLPCPKPLDKHHLAHSIGRAKSSRPPHYRKSFRHRYSLQGRRSERARRAPNGVTGKARTLKSTVGVLLVLLCPRVSVAGTFVAFGPKTYR